MILGYARVSKGEAQDTRMQETALRAAGVERLFTEQASGGRWDRPHLHRLLDQLRPEDVVIVWKLDRLSRSLKDLLHIMERIAQAGAGFRSLTEAIDTTTPAGRMLMQMVGSFAEFERAMIRERTQALGPWEEPSTWAHGYMSACRRAGMSTEAIRSRSRSFPRSLYDALDDILFDERVERAVDRALERARLRWGQGKP